ncbi:MAG: DUF1385 domain-containing protein, partial [Oscillospiraceae bacterium]
KGPTVTAMALRLPDGTVDVSQWETSAKKPWYKKTMFVRGIFGFFDSIYSSFKCLMKSADAAGMEDEEPSKFEKWLIDKLGEKFETTIGFTAMLLGMFLAVSLFIVLPTVLIGFLRPYVQNKILLSLVEAIVKVGIFVLYIFAISRMSYIKRVFMYHGAEHKTIACYESGEELTVENVRTKCRFHPRCGTSFLLIVVIVSVMVFSLVSWNSLAMRIVLKFLCLPLVVGIAYEIIRYAGAHDNFLSRFLSAPGLWLQRLTTAEPDDSMIEIAIASMLPCIPTVKGEDKW